MNWAISRISIITASLLFGLGAAHAAEAGIPDNLQTPKATLGDFDPLHGRWHTSVRRLLKPLSGSQEWAEYEGTGDVHSFLDGQANVSELDVSGPRGRIRGVSVRLYDTNTKRWTIQFASMASGVLDPGIAGGFAGGTHGVFYGADTWQGRPIVVRFVIDVADPQTVRYEQAFSADGGANWEVNWIATDKRR